MTEWHGSWGRESATQRCPSCRRSFHVLADEIDSHPCPSCGYAPWEGGDVYCGECGSMTNHDTDQHKGAAAEANEP